jgi:invasion protein IalB
MRLPISLHGLILAAAFLPGLALMTDTVFAQGAPAPATGQASPQATGASTMTENKTVGDWTVRCFAVQSQSPCDMYEELQDQNSHQRVLGVSIAYVPSQDRNVVQVAVPLGVAIQQGVVIKTDAYTSPSLPFRRCDQGGCYVEMVLDPTILGGLTKSGPQGSVTVVSDDGKSFALRFSLNGFASAHDSMVGLAKEKIAGAASTAAAPKKK